MLDSPARKGYDAFYHGDMIDNVDTFGFSIFAANRSRASNLKHLRSSAGQLTVNKSSGLLESLYAILAETLAKYRKLMNLDGDNSGVTYICDHPLYSSVLISTITPKIQKKRIETLKLTLEGNP